MSTEDMFGAKPRSMERREFLRLSGAGIAGMALVYATGCGGGETIGGQQSGGGGGNVFTFGHGPDAISLDPINQTDSESSIVIGQVFDGLLKFAPGSTRLVPGLAVEVPEPDRDGLVYDFRLRKGVEFHDGAPFDAEAVVFNIERWKNTGHPYHKGGGSQSTDFSYYASLFGGFDEDSVIESVEATGTHEVRFTLKRPQGPFLKNLASTMFTIASPKAIQEDVENFWQNPVGSGAFRFVSWEKGSEVRLEKNPRWWGTDVPVDEGGGGPNVKTLIFRSIPDNTSRVAALTGGQLSAADGLTPDDVPTIEQNPDLRIRPRPPLNVGYLAMNNERKPFDDPLVRRAVAHAINLPEIVEAFYGETGEVASNPMPSELEFFNENVEPYAYDPDEARRLLEEAGFPDGFKTNLYYMPIPRPYMPDGKGIAQAIQRDLEKVGINPELLTYEFGTYIERTGQGEHDMALLGWTSANNDADFHLNSLLSSRTATETNAQNISYYKNPEVDRLLTRARETINQDERRRLYYRAQEIIHEDTPMVPIVYAEPPVGLQRQVKGYRPSPGGDRFNAVELSGGA